MSNDSIDKLAKMLAEELPQNLKSMRDDLEQNFRAVLKTGLERLDLVTREEFEVQEAVLLRAREKLEKLDARLKDMEASAAGRATTKKKKAKKTARKKSGKSSKKKSKR